MLYIPKKLAVGYQNRSDTYTGKLAYVVYYDEKNKLKKEKSWQTWRDVKIDADEFDNTPTAGFVMNKKIGGYKSSWNMRNAYFRMYDPRGFEFEITPDNLTYILECTNSVVGKGFEGEFVYAWEGSQLILLPTTTPEYISISNVSNLRNGNSFIKAKELVIGGTYLDKQNNESVYIGRFDRWDRYYSVKHTAFVDRNTGLAYFFIEPNGTNVSAYKSISNKFIQRLSDQCVDNYAELYERVCSTTLFSPLDQSATVYVAYTEDEFRESLIRHHNISYTNSYFNKQGERLFIRRFNNNSIGNDEDTWAVSDDYYWSRNTQLPLTVSEILLYHAPHYQLMYLQNGLLYSTTKGRE